MVMVSGGLWLIYEPLALIVPGLGLVLLAQGWRTES